LAQVISPICHQVHYNVRIRDAVNTACVAVLNGALVVSEPPVLSATVSRTNITCFGSSDGTIRLPAQQEDMVHFEYSINGGGSWQLANNFTNLVPGTYNVQMRDAAYPSCYIVLNNALVLTQPSVLTATVASTNVTCNGADDGTISINRSFGWIWDLWIFDRRRWQLAAGKYFQQPGTRHL